MPGVSLLEALNISSAVNQTGEDWIVEMATPWLELLPLPVSYFIFVNVTQIVDSILIFLYISNLHYVATHMQNLPEGLADLIFGQFPERVFQNATHLVGPASGFYYLGCVYDMPYRNYVGVLAMMIAFVPVFNRIIGLRILVTAGLAKERIGDEMYTKILNTFVMPPYDQHLDVQRNPN